MLLKYSLEQCRPIELPVAIAAQFACALDPSLPPALLAAEHVE